MLKIPLYTLVLPVCLVVGGCNATQTNSTTDSNAATIVTPAPDANTTSTAPAPAESSYKITDPSSEGLPANVVEALKKVALPPPPASMPTPKKATLLFTTSQGKIKVELNGVEAPLQVKSFVYLAKKGFFNGTLFHRYADLLKGSGTQGRIIQGGDPLTKTPSLKKYWGAGGPGYEVPREHNKLTHEAFVIAAARSQDPDSAGSQFYFTVDAIPFLDQGDGYTVFGKVVSGQDVVAKLRAGDKQHAGDKLESVTVLPDSK